MKSWYRYTGLLLDKVLDDMPMQCLETLLHPNLDATEPLQVELQHLSCYCKTPFNIAVYHVHVIAAAETIIASSEQMDHVNWCTRIVGTLTRPCKQGLPSRDEHILSRLSLQIFDKMNRRLGTAFNPLACVLKFAHPDSRFRFIQTLLQAEYTNIHPNTDECNGTVFQGLIDVALLERRALAEMLLVPEFRQAIEPYGKHSNRHRLFAPVDWGYGICGSTTYLNHLYHYTRLFCAARGKLFSEPPDLWLDCRVAKICECYKGFATLPQKITVRMVQRCVVHVVTEALIRTGRELLVEARPLEERNTALQVMRRQLDLPDLCLSVG